MFRITPKYKKSFIESGIYSKTIGDIEYTIEKYMVWRHGSLDVMLTNAEI